MDGETSKCFPFIRVRTSNSKRTWDDTTPVKKLIVGQHMTERGNDYLITPYSNICASNGRFPSWDLANHKVDFHVRLNPVLL
jgi:hypothetical protein